MINAVTTAGTLDWKGWSIGLMGALISGISSAVIASSTNLVIGLSDPDHFELTAKHIVMVAVLPFVGSGLVSMFKYLQLHPVPDAMQAALAVASQESGKAVSQVQKAADAVADAQAAIPALPTEQAPQTPPAGSK